MFEYSEAYLHERMDGFKFFDPNCEDTRYREVAMRQKVCLHCPGLDDCKTYPFFWLEGEKERRKEDKVLRKEGRARS